MNNINATVHGKKGLYYGCDKACATCLHWHGVRKHGGFGCDYQYIVAEQTTVGTCRVKKSPYCSYDGTTCEQYKLAKIPFMSAVTLAGKNESDKLDWLHENFPAGGFIKELEMTLRDLEYLPTIISELIKELKKNKHESKNKEEIQLIKRAIKIWKQRKADFVVPRQVSQTSAYVSNEQYEATKKRTQELQDAAWRYDTFGW